MKRAKRNIFEVGLSLIFLGSTMILFPTFFETAEKYKQNADDGQFIGISLIVIGSLVLLGKYLSKYNIR